MMRVSRGDSERKAGWLILLFLLVLSLATLHSGCAGVASSGNPSGPTVSITSPTSGATVSASTTLSANASSDAVGVQFKLDGANLGSEKSSVPFSFSWDTSTAANGAHTLTAVARNAAGRTATSGGVSVTVQNSSGGGPTISITSPTPGATLSGTSTLTAVASSPIGIAGVQFLLDGGNLGAEVTAAPYSYSWDTTVTSNGAHTLAGRVRDTAGATATSAGVAVTVSNGSGGSDFQTRCSAPGVVKCVGFDSPAEIVGVWGDPSGILPGESTPVIDTAVKASGNGSIKFTIPANSGSDSSGSYFTNFSNDLSVQFDSGQEFYVQWRQRFSPEFITTQYAGGGGWKQAIITEGDHPGSGCSSSFTTPCITSCTDIGVIVQNTDQLEFPQMYHSCGTKDGLYEPLQEPIGSPPTDFYLQNNIRNPGGCLYSTHAHPPCLGYFANEWMTFQVHIKVGTWYLNNHVYLHDSWVQMWVAREGQAPQLVIDYSPHDPGCAAQQVSQPPCQTGYDLVRVNTPLAKYGKIWLLPYHTGKDPSVAYPVAYTWYDELIISRNKIADPR